MEVDEIPQLPDLQKEKYLEDFESILKDLEKSKRVLVFYESLSGEFKYEFSNLDHVFYSNLVAELSRNEKRCSDLYTFIKLCLEGVRLVKQNSKKSKEIASRLENYIKKLPDDTSRTNS